MNVYRNLLFSFFLFAVTCFAQNAEKIADKLAPPDFSQESFIVESLKSNLRFEADGTATKRSETKIKLQSEAAVQKLGQLVFNYNSEFEKLTFTGRVIKSDGAKVEIPESAVQDMSAPVSRVAPMYSDVRQKHVIVPSLRPGDVLEYEVQYDQFAPLAPNHFWTSHNFNEDYVVLSEELTIDVPAAKYVNVKSRDEYKPEVREQKGRRIYTWETAHLERTETPEKKDKKKKKDRKDEDEVAAVQVSTFKTWDEIGTWYASLEKDRLAPDDAIRAKAVELTKDLKTGDEKLEALYTYVAQTYRYVSLSFGLGRYQPHAASEIFTNHYGDCKDKHTLLASMISAISLHSDAALTSAAHKVDTTFPSPAQFDHVITYVPEGKDAIWLDTTSDLAPFRQLLPTVRGKSALVIAANGKSEVKEIPDEPAVRNHGILEVRGKVNELGTLDADVHITFRGDLEVIGRLTIRAIPQAKWKDYVEYLAKASGLDGDITNIQFSDFADTKKPLEYRFHVVKLNYFNRYGREPKLTFPMGGIDFKNPEEPENDKPIELSGGVTEYHVKLEVPKQFQTQLPLPVKLKRDFAQYESNYSSENDVITAERKLDINVTKLPAARFSEFDAFHRIVTSDVNQRISVTLDKTAPPEEASDIKVDELLRSSYAAYANRDYQACIDLIQRAIAKEPKHKTAYNDLGRAYHALGKNDEAEKALKTAIEIDPYSAFAYNNLGLVYREERRYPEAEQAFKKQIDVDPLDKWSHANLGEMYNQQKRFADAEPELEKALAITPDSASILMALGNAQLNLGKADKAQASFAKAISLSATPASWNNVAYMLAEHKSNLDLAQQYAESAVATLAAQLRNVELADLRIQQLGSVSLLAMSWDTLGWVHFAKGNTALAEKYLLAAWNLGQRPTIGDHLGQLYEQKGDREKAIKFYAMALSAPNPESETTDRLAKLVGKKKVDKYIDQYRTEFLVQQVFPLVNAKGAGKADFYIKLSPSNKVDDVRFISGDEKLKDFGLALRKIDFQPNFPDQNDTRLVRRGTLSCGSPVMAPSANPVKQASSKEKDAQPKTTSEPGLCTFVLTPPDQVRSVN